MEGIPLTTSNDPEISFDTKKPKDKRKKFELQTPEAAVAWSQRRHLAREALKFGENQELSEYRQRAPEAKQLHNQQKAPEHIGHMLITAEATKRQKIAPERIKLEPNKRIETLSRVELLDVSDRIAVGNTSLRHVYETHLIGEHALRRLIAVYLENGDIQKALQREIVEHEIDFERDPALRDKAAASTDADDTIKDDSAADQSLSQLLQKAQAGIVGNDDELSYNKVPSSSPKTQVAQVQHRRPIDLVMGAIIVVLVILVVTLYFMHR